MAVSVSQEIIYVFSYNILPLIICIYSLLANRFIFNELQLSVLEDVIS